MSSIRSEDSFFPKHYIRMRQRAGVILFCKDEHGNKKYLLGNESRWLKDLAEKSDWNAAFEQVSETKCPKGMPCAKHHFDQQRPIVQALFPDMPIHYAQIDYKDDMYKTKWMAEHLKPKWGFPKGGCEPHDDSILECARREFHEETLSKLPGTVLDSISFLYKRDNEIELFVCEVEYDIMDRIVDHFAKNKKENKGDGTEFSDLKVFSRAQLKRMASHGETNEVAAIAIKKLFERRASRKSASPALNKTLKHKKEWRS